MTNTDLSFMFDAAVGGFVGIMVVETVVKPIAIVIGKFLLKKIDDKVKWLPDFLSK